MKRPLYKRLASALLIAVLLIALNAVPVAAGAVEWEKPETITATASYVNPVYANLEEPASNGATVSATEETYAVADAQEAAAVLKGQMQLRTESVTIQLPVDIPYDANNKEAFWAEVWAMEKEIFAKAIAHTGDPEEGDYLLYNYHRRQLKASASLGETTTVAIGYTFTYHADAQQEQAVDTLVNRLLAELNVTNASDYEKICAAYDWLCQNVDYTDTIYEAPSTIYSAYGALVNRSCVCQGYAVALYRLLLELGVDCRVISGTDADGGGHAWNIIRLDGLYYNADATWDTSWLEAGLDYAWFLKCEDSFSEHIRDEAFTTENFYAAYPMAVATGTSGDGLTWILDSNGLLTVSGEGAMGNYMEDGAPWYDYLEDIKKAEIREGVTGIGDSAFSGCFALDGVILSEELTVIGAKVFYGCDALSSITIPQNVTQIGETAFGSCIGLREIRFLGDAPTIGEDAFAEVTAKAYYPAQNATWTAAVKQGYGGNLTWLQEGLFALSGTSVSLGDSLDMHFVLDPTYVDTDCCAVLTRYYSNGTDEAVVTVPYSEWKVLDDGRLYVTYGNIAAKEMGDYVTVEICDGEGNAISQLYVDSIKSYAMRMLEKEEVIANQELRTLYVDMLNYGAAAQAQFGYNVTMPANDLLTEEQLAYATASYETENHLMACAGRAGTSLTLKNRITLDFIFKNTAIGTDYTGLYAIAAYTDHYGNEIETRIDTVKAFSDHYGYVSVPGLAVADYGQTVTCTVYDAEGNILAWATDSMEGYAHRMKGNLPEMVEAIIKFGNASYNYFH